MIKFNCGVLTGPQVRGDVTLSRSFRGSRSSRSRYDREQTRNSYPTNVMDRGTKER